MWYNGVWGPRPQPSWISPRARRCCTAGGITKGHFNRSVTMSYRKSVNKYRSANKFRRHMSNTKAVNMRPQPMRGGFRL